MSEEERLSELVKESGIPTNVSTMFQGSGSLENTETIHKSPATDTPELSVNTSSENMFEPLGAIPLIRSGFRRKFPPGLSRKDPGDTPVPKPFDPFSSPQMITDNIDWDPMGAKDSKNDAETLKRNYELRRRQIIHRNERTVHMRKTELQVIFSRCVSGGSLASNGLKRPKLKKEIVASAGITEEGRK